MGKMHRNSFHFLAKPSNIGSCRCRYSGSAIKCKHKRKFLIIKFVIFNKQKHMQKKEIKTENNYKIHF